MHKHIGLHVEPEHDLQDSRVQQTIRQNQGEAVPVVVILLDDKELPVAEGLLGLDGEDVGSVEHLLRVDDEVVHQLVQGVDDLGVELLGAEAGIRFADPLGFELDLRLCLQTVGLSTNS